MGKHKKQKDKKKMKKHKKETKEYPSLSSSESEFEWVEAGSSKKEKDGNSSSQGSSSKNEKDRDKFSPEPSSNISNQRDEWMNLQTLFTSTSSKDRQNKREKDKKEKAELEIYNPSKCARELNPYWKDGGDGLPKFAKPRYDSDDECSNYHSRNRVRQESSWRKRMQNCIETKEEKREERERRAQSPEYRDKKYMQSSKERDSEREKRKEKRRDYSPEQTYRRNKRDNSQESLHKKVRSRDNSPKEKCEAQIQKIVASGSKQTELPKDEIILSEKELNLLAGKLVKAEIMGNTKVVEELKAKLEKARKAVEEARSDGTYEEVLLTHTDSKGRSQPVKLKSDYEAMPGGRKQKRIKTETHNTNNERVRYFADDDSYSLKQMFEEEKFGNSYRQERDFVELSSKVKKNDDLDDLFTDEVRRTKSDSKIDMSNRDKAIKEHQKMVKTLDNCNRCIQSESSLKHLIVSMGEYVYLGLPAREPLTDGHCYIVPIRHVSCSTALDENEWSEIMDFRKALLKYFQTKDEEPIFCESAMHFHKQSHMIIECIPVSQEDNMAPIYFKKAIDESETEWAQNKKLVSLEGRDVRKAIPKGLPYFFVSFGLKEGYAHVIEDEKMFPKNFAQEIIGGMLDLHHNKWRNPNRESFNEQSKRVLKFSDKWKNFDCLNRI